MKISNHNQLILSPMSRISTAILITVLTVMASAKTNYSMTVVTEATVNPKSKMTEPSIPFQCNTTISLIKSSANLMWYNTPHAAAEKIQQIDKNSAIIATRNTDDGYLNSVILWLKTSVAGKISYFQLTEVDMLRYELPKVAFKNNTLYVEAETITVDPRDKDEVFQVPSLEQQLRQTVSVAIKPDQLSLTTLSCLRDK